MRFLTQADAGTRTPDPLLTMEVLYQLSYVGATPNPSVIAADRDMIGARNDHRCPVVPGGVFLAVLGAFQGQFWPETSRSRSQQAPKTQPGRDLAYKETSLAIHGKDEVRGSSPRVGSTFLPQRHRSSIHFLSTVVRCCRSGNGHENPAQESSMALYLEIGRPWSPGMVSRRSPVQARASACPEIRLTKCFTVPPRTRPRRRRAKPRAISLSWAHSASSATSAWARAS
jgi:hypothetical protein